jgi:hypothetical protein
MTLARNVRLGPLPSVRVCGLCVVYAVLANVRMRLSYLGYAQN